MRYGLRSSLVALIALGGSACFVGKTSPAVYGVDLRVAPGFAVGDAGMTVHPTVAYARSVFGGVDGETDGVIHLGGQLRFSSARTEEVRPGLWFGAEATYARRSTSFDFVGVPSATSNGWTLAALAGFPVVEGNAGAIHGYAALGLNKYGGTGPYLRVGIDLQPAFLSR